MRRRRYKIIERNYRSQIGEIDIVAYKGGVYVFVEVKTRRDETFGRPAEAVTSAKQRKYRLMAMQYMNSKGLYDSPFRFDVIEILGKEINHIENAF